MAENKRFQGRISLKHDTAEHWALAENFIPLAGEMIIYDADASNPVRYKIGDGVTNVNTLPFAGANITMRTWTATDMEG